MGIAVGLAVTGCVSDRSPTATDPSSVSPPPTVVSSESVTSAPPVLSAAALDRADDLVRWHLAANGLDGAGLVLVDADRGIVYQRYWGDFGPDRVSLIASSSKMITATVLLGLAGDGVLDIDAPISELVDWAPDFSNVTIADLLSSTSGLVGLAPNALYPPYLCQLDANENLSWCGVQIANSTDDDGDVVPPHTEFRYGGAQWQLAGAIAVAVTGQSWDELLDRYLREPCQVDSLGYTNQWLAFGTGFTYPYDHFDGDVADLPVTENPNMEGGGYINPVDYATLLLMHLNGGRCGDAQPVPAELIERSHRDRLAEVGVTLGADRGYGLGWWVDLDDRSVSDPGAYGTYAWINPERGYGAYLVLEANSERAGNLFDQIQPELVRALDPDATQTRSILPSGTATPLVDPPNADGVD